MTLHSGFQPKVVIEDPARLFGHNRPKGLLERFCVQLRMGTSTQLLGERNSGKSSVLNCARARLRQQASPLLSVLVSYQKGIDDWADGYRYFLASIHAELARQLPEEASLELRGVTLEGRPEVQPHLERLRGLATDQVCPAFDDYFKRLAARRLGVVLMIDEYEYFLRETFANDVLHFWSLRDLATRAPIRAPMEKPPPLLTVVLAGSKEWTRLCQDRVPAGSPALNMVTHTIYAEPIEAEDFRQMWAACLDDSAAEVRHPLETKAVDPTDVYRLAGGWPFCGKVIGQHLVTAGALEEQDLLEQLEESHFKKIWEQRTEPQQKQLLAALDGRDVGHVKELRQRGLVELDENRRLCPRGQLWRLYLEQRQRRGPAPGTQTDSSVEAPAEPRVPQYIFRLSGVMFHLRFEEEDGHFPTWEGLTIIHRQLQRQNSSQVPSAVQLLQGCEKSKGAEISRQAVTEEKELEEYRQRYFDMKDEPDIAAVDDRDDILKIIRESVYNPDDFLQGQKPKLKTLGTTTEGKAKDNIRNNISNAYKKLERTMPKLVAHLKDSLRAENTWAYSPKQVPPWQLD